jgi:hypothetical protein
MAAYEVLLLNTVVPQIQAAQAGDSYVMVVNATTPALRITQTGTGDSILVEDAANPDSSPFVVTAAGDVGIGTASPTFKLQVICTSQLSLSAAGTQQALQLNNSDTTAGTQAVKLGFSSAGVTKASINAAVYGNDYMTFNVGSDTERMRLDASGNLGLGVTPSAWGTDYKAIQIGGSATAALSYKNFVTSLSQNVYSTNSNDVALVSGNSAKYELNGSGQHVWKTAAVTENTNISFTQAMTLDASGRLGVGPTTVEVKLHVAAANPTNGVLQFIQNTSTSAQTGALLKLDVGNVGTSALGIPGGAANALAFYVGGVTSGSERARITSGGDFQTSSGGSVQVGGTAARATTAGTNRVDIFDGTAPVGTLANGVSFYSAAGEANVMDAAGNATLLSPHDSETNEWIFRSKHTPTGKVLKIDVEKMLRFINDHFGLDAIHEFTEE